MIKASAPGRAGIIGNPTDMYGGAVISCSIAERAHCYLSASDSLAITVTGDTLEVTNSDQLELDGSKFDVVKSALQAMELEPSECGFALTVWTEIPEQAGLAGSTAMLSCIVGCLLEYLELNLNKYELAETVRKIESDILGITCGYQDQYMAAFGGLNYVDCHGKQLMTQSDDEPFATVEPLHDVVTELPAVLAHTGVKRCSGTVHKSVRDRWLEGEEEVVKGYERIADLARLGKKALCAQDWEELGRLMNENHAIQSEIAGSSECNEHLIRVARSHGAYGAKLAGAGQGGTIIALADNVGRMADVLLAAGAERILIPRPTDGLVIEREWSLGYYEQSTGSYRSRGWLDRRGYLREERRRRSA